MLNEWEEKEERGGQRRRKMERKKMKEEGETHAFKITKDKKKELSVIKEKWKQKIKTKEADMVMQDSHLSFSGCWDRDCEFEDSLDYIAN